MLDQLGFPLKIVAESYIDAFQYRPHRPESIYYLAELYNRNHEYEKAYFYLKMYEVIEKPEHKDALFNVDWISDYGLLFQLSICSYYAEQYEESLAACNQLLTIRDLPENWRSLTETNLKFPLEKLPKTKK
jgi:tetratricopeptide (TPR) repeat protein